MKTRNKVLLLLTILLLTLSLTACSRGRFRQGWRTSATPAAASPEQTPVPDDLSRDAVELDDLMNEIDRILKDTDTSVDVP